MRYPFKACKLISVLMAAAVFPLARWLPAEWTWENGIVENLQVFLLLAAIAGNWYLYSCRRGLGFISRMYLWQCGFFLLLAGRELSWGRVFFPTGIGPKGPYFTHLPPTVRFIVHALVALSVCTLIVTLLLWAPWGRLLSFDYDIPWIFFIVAAACTVITMVAEYCQVGNESLLAQAVEELAETVVYFATVNISAWYAVELDPANQLK